MVMMVSTITLGISSSYAEDRIIDRSRLGGVIEEQQRRESETIQLENSSTFSRNVCVLFFWVRDFLYDAGARSFSPSARISSPSTRTRNSFCACIVALVCSCVLVFFALLSFACFACSRMVSA